MGKKLIIEGADFSANAVPTVVVDVTTNYTTDDFTHSGYGINYSTGVLTPMNGWGAGDYVPLVEGNTIKLTCGNAANTLGIAFYSSESESNYINGVKLSIQSAASLTIPSGTQYVRFSGMLNDSTFLVAITRQEEQ